MARTLIGSINNLSKRNRIINGAFDFWQRGTSNTNTLSGSLSNALQYLGPDRFRIGAINDFGENWTRATTTNPDGNKYVLQITGDPFAASNPSNYIRVAQRIEANNIADLAGKEASFGFLFEWRDADLDQLYVDFLYPDAEDDWSGDTTFLTVDLTDQLTGTPQAGNWIRMKALGVVLDENCSRGLEVIIRGLNSSTNTSFSMAVTSVMLNEGSSLAPFRRAASTYEEELAMCRRFYEKSWPHDLLVGTQANSSVGARYCTVADYEVNSDRVYFGTSGKFLVQKRAVPTIEIWNHRGDFQEDKISRYNANDNDTINPALLGVDVMGINGYTQTTLTSRTTWGFHFTADAEL